MRILAALASFLFLSIAAVGQGTGSAPPASTARPSPAQAARPGGFDLAEYGVAIQPDARLIVMMAALDAAGFDPVPRGAAPSAFRARVRADQAGLDSDLRRRMKDFFVHHNSAGGLTPAEQASRYVSLAYALSPAPAFESPARTDDLPAGVLEVLDFAPLLREFYRRSGIEERLPGYLRVYQAQADALRKPTAEMVRSVLSYLHTRPVTVFDERVKVTEGATGKKKAREGYTVRERACQAVLRGA